MDRSNTLPMLVLASDLLMLVTMASVWMALRRAGASGGISLLLAAILAVVLLWGGTWAFVPALASLRTLPAPRGQAGAILTVVVAFTALLALPPVRHFFRTGRMEWLVTLGAWRVVYGATLLMMGLLGGLPSAFFWSAAFGDIAVGIWAFAIMARRLDVRPAEITAWNAVGLADLTHVLVLGALNMGPFYTANPGVQPLNLLPLAGVPVFLAIHVMTLWGIAARRQAGLASASAPQVRP
jgi:hypothetical protein